MTKTEDKKSAGEKAANKFYAQLQTWLCDNGRVYSKGDLIKQLVNNKRQHYMRAQTETLALLNWMKKFVDAYLQETGEQG